MSLKVSLSPNASARSRVRARGVMGAGPRQIVSCTRVTFRAERHCGDLGDVGGIGHIALAYGNELPDDPTLRSVELSRTRIGIRLPSEHRLARKAKLRVADIADESILMGPRRLRPRLYDDIIAAVRARGVVLNLAPEVGDGEAVWTLVSSGLGLTFATESGARFLDAGRATFRPGAPSIGAAVWRPLVDLGVEVADIAVWRADAAQSPLLQPLLAIVREQRRRTAQSAARASKTASRRVRKV